jgi:L-fuculose-phosphate aldolase
VSAFVTRHELLEVCKLVYDRELTDAAGSNFSARASASTFYVTPHGNAKRTRLRMRSDDILLVDDADHVLDGQGAVSSSWSTHRRIYAAFPDVGVVVHAHPKLATVVACGPGPMEPLLDAMKKYGPIPLVPRKLPVDSPEFGDAVVELLRRDETGLQRHGQGVLYPFHGVLVAAPDLDDAFDLLERMEFNAASLLFAPRGTAPVWQGAHLE